MCVYVVILCSGVVVSVKCSPHSSIFGVIMSPSLSMRYILTAEKTAMYAIHAYCTWFVHD